MQLEAEPKVYQQIENSPVLQQTAYWAEVKQQQGFITKAFDVKIKSKDEMEECPYVHQGQLFDDVLVILQPINSNYQMAYIPYGPLAQPNEDAQGEYLEELAENIRPYLPDNCILIRFDLLWESPWAKDEDRYQENGFWQGPPESQFQEMRVNFNTREWNLRKAPTDNLPVNTMFLDLTNTTDDLLMNMKPKTRYNIRLAQRKGVEVKEVTPEKLGVWSALYEETAKRNGIHLNNHWMKDFETVINSRADKTKSPADIHLLMAEKEGRALAGMFLAVSGNRATYLYGASSLEQRNSMATYALQWDAISRARQLGCTEYDFFGVSPNPDPSHPMYGLYRFKKGFGGEMYHRMGCWDYPLNKKVYEVFHMAERNAQGYHVKG